MITCNSKRKPVTGLVDRGAAGAGIIAAAFMLAAGCASHETATQTGESDPVLRGQAIAREDCSACHAVGLGEMDSPKAAAPSFQSLANRSDLSRLAITALLRTPHKSMPNLIIKPDEIDALTAYLEAIRSEL